MEYSRNTIAYLTKPRHEIPGIPRDWVTHDIQRACNAGLVLVDEALLTGSDFAFNIGPGTGYIVLGDSTHAAKRWLELGAMDVQRHPINTDLLITRLDSLLALKERIKGREIGKKLLYIDDEPIFINLFNESFKLHYDVSILKHPNRIESVLPTIQPDIVVTDVVFSDNSGFEMVKAVHKWNPCIPVFLASRLKETSVMMKGYEAGAVGFIMKPFTDSSMLSIRNTLDFLNGHS